MILVTGGSGFVGGRVVDRLRAEGKPVRVLVRNARSAGLPSAVEVFEGDLTRPKTSRAALTGVDVLIHAAALTGDRKEPYRGAYDQVNCVGTERLMAAAKRTGVRKVVLISELGTKPGRPGSYMSTRWAMEEAVRSSGIPYVILRPSVLFGDGAAFIKGLARVVRASPVAPATGWELKLRPLWINDLTRCIGAAAETDALIGSELALTGAEQISMRELMALIAQSLGKRAWVVPFPVFAAKLQARAMNRILSRPSLIPAAAELLSHDNPTVLDSVEGAFGFRPRGFREYVLAHGLELEARSGGIAAEAATAAAAGAELAGKGGVRAAQPAPGAADHLDVAAPPGASRSDPELAPGSAGAAAGDENHRAATPPSTRDEPLSPPPSGEPAETIEPVQVAEPRGAGSDVAKEGGNGEVEDAQAATAKANKPSSQAGTETTTATPSGPTVSNSEGAAGTISTEGVNQPQATDPSGVAPVDGAIVRSRSRDSPPPATMALEEGEQGPATTRGPAGKEARPPTARKRRDPPAPRGRKPKRD